MRPLRVATQQFADIYPNVENQVDLVMKISNGEYPGVGNIEIDAAKQLEDAFAKLLNE